MNFRVHRKLRYAVNLFIKVLIIRSESSFPININSSIFCFWMEHFDVSKNRWANNLGFFIWNSCDTTDGWLSFAAVFSIVSACKWWEFREQGLTVFRMADTVNNWIVASIGLGKHWSPDGGNWWDLCCFKDAGKVDHQVWCPGHEPQCNGGQCNFSQFAFSAGVLCFRRSQWSNIHFFGLFAHVFLVSCHSLLNKISQHKLCKKLNYLDFMHEKCRAFYLDDKVVWVDDQEQWSKVHKEAVDQDVWAAEPVFCQVVSAAGGHVTFWNISVPAKHGRKCPDQCVDPNEENSQSSAAVCQWFALLNPKNKNIFNI